jgi:hypothetical protein
MAGDGVRMDYGKLKQRVLIENDLMGTVDPFIKGDDEVYYADRHALEWSGYHYDPYALDPVTIKLGVMLGLDLLRHWSVQRKAISSLHISEPFLCIDEEWLLGRANPAPPSVKICLAKSEKAFSPVPFEGTRRDLILDSEVDLSGTTVVFGEGYEYPDEDEILGAWLIRLGGGHSEMLGGLKND